MESVHRYYSNDQDLVFVMSKAENLNSLRYCTV